MEVPTKSFVRDGATVPSLETFERSGDAEERKRMMQEAGYGFLAEDQGPKARTATAAQCYREMTPHEGILWRAHLRDTLNVTSKFDIEMPQEPLAHLHTAKGSGLFDSIETWARPKVGEFMAVGIVKTRVGQRLYQIVQWNEKGKQLTTIKRLRTRRACKYALMGAVVAALAAYTMYLLGSVFGSVVVGAILFLIWAAVLRSVKPQRRELGRAFRLTTAALMLVVGAVMLVQDYRHTSTTTAVVCTVDIADDGYHYPLRTSKGTFKVPTELLPNDLYEGDEVAIKHREWDKAVKGVEVTKRYYGRPPTHTASCG